MRNPGRDISFPIFIRKEIETRKLERKSKQKNISFNRLIISFKRYYKSLKRYKIEWKLKQKKKKTKKKKKKNRMEIKSRKTEKKLKQTTEPWKGRFFSNIYQKRNRNKKN